MQPAVIVLFNGTKFITKDFCTKINVQRIMETKIYFTLDTKWIYFLQNSFTYQKQLFMLCMLRM